MNRDADSLMYDYVFVTHLPAFYKVNLYNELAKSLKIYVIFLGTQSNERTPDFVSTDLHFAHVFLSEGTFEARNQFKSLFKFTKLILKLKYRHLVVGGWNLSEFWCGVLLSSAQKNALALESTANEGELNGVRGALKRFFLKRITLVLASGKAHSALLHRLGFEGNIKITGGVGLMRKNSTRTQSKIYEKKFVYLGRLVPEKNLSFLLNVFSQLPEFNLEIIGDGPEREELEQNASANVHFIPHIDNSELKKVFDRNDFLILPSLHEPWGLVIEEALFYGRPVVVSANCGATEIVNKENGYIIDPRDPDALVALFKSITSLSFAQLLRNVLASGIEEKDHKQINTYTGLRDPA